MNLLIDPWVPVRQRGEIRRVTYRDILCRDQDWELCLPRDDMEMACLQMLVCLTQVLFMPSDADALLQAEQTLMAESTFDRIAGQRHELFDLFHPKWPFMQVRGVKAENDTPIQKLFVGLPEGNNHALFHARGELERVCPSCAAIALFNQASNCPQVGGGFKAPLRGSASITVMVQGNTLRSTIWRNVLSKSFLEARGLPVVQDDQPVWVKPIQPKQAAHEIGLFRGLFWQPLRAELCEPAAESAICPACGIASDRFIRGFRKEKFTYDVIGQWPHPHSPSFWELRKGQRVDRFMSFTVALPAWTQLSELLLNQQTDQAGRVPPAAVTQLRDLHGGEELRMAVGGYCNNQAAILERRHEMVSLARGWGEGLEQVGQVVQRALAIRDVLHKHCYGFGKQVGISAVARSADRLFYQRSERCIHSLLESMDPRQAIQAIDKMDNELGILARSIFEEVLLPYAADPKGLRALSLARPRLGASLAKIRKGA